MDERNVHTNSSQETHVQEDEGPLFSSREAAILVGVLVIGIVVWLFLGGTFNMSDNGGPGDTAQVIEDMRELDSLSQTYDTESVLMRVDDVLQAAQEADAPAFVEAQIQTRKAVNLFRTNDEDNQREAVRILKGVANDDRLDRMWYANTINRLLSFYYSGRESHVFDEIFSGEQFVDIRGANEKESMRNLAERSMALYPTSIGALRVANWYSGELLDNPDLAQETRNEYREELQNLVAQAQALFDQEMETATVGDYDMVIHNHWSGFHAGALAAEGVDVSGLSFEDYFESAINQYSGNAYENADIATIVVYTHFYYAAFLHEVYGEERLDDQQALLSDLVDMVNENPELYETGFIDFASVERDREPETRDHNYRWFVELADVSPEFREFLESNGWEL